MDSPFTNMPIHSEHSLTVHKSILALEQTVEWDEMRFDVRLLQRVPYEGISRMQTSLRRRHRDRVVRRYATA